MKNLQAEHLRLLEEQGHVLLSITNEAMFDDLANSLGTPISSREGGPLKDVLDVKDQEEAHTRSLSKQFGRGRFPFHTDMAHLHVPPRFVLLRSVGTENSRQTFVMDVSSTPLAKARSNALECDIWFVNGGRTSFFTPLVNKTIVKGSSIFRYDSEVMRPADGVDGDSVGTITLMKGSLPFSRYTLSENQCLLIDNWRAMHGRGAEPAKSDKDTRKLERYLILQK